MSNKQEEDRDIGNNEVEALQIQTSNDAYSEPWEDEDEDDDGDILSPMCKYWDQHEIMAALIKIIIVDELPFKFVEGEGFKHYVSVACPGFIIPDRCSVIKDCYQLYVDERTKLKSFIKTNCKRVCISTETWASLQGIDYMCITAHFIDNEWNLHKKILNFVPVSSHRGEDLGKTLENCLLDWELKNVFTLTVDNASPNATVVSFLTTKLLDWGSGIASCKYLHMRCIAHVINSVVSDALKQINPSVVRVRDAVTYIRDSPARLRKFKQCVDLEGIESKSALYLDVSTGWNSTYLMLATAEKYERAFVKFDEQDSSFRADLGDGGVPTSLDWTCVRKYVDLLKPFYEFTLLISGSSYATSSSVFSEISELCCILNVWKESTDCKTKSSGESMKKKLDKYWGDPEKVNKIIFWANVFDPRAKFEFIEYSLCELYGAEKGAKIFQCVKNELFELFNEYKSKYHPESEASDGNNSLCSAVMIGGETVGNVPRSIMKDRYKKQKMEGEIAGSKKSELEIYLSEAVVDDEDNLDVLKWWKERSGRFRILSSMARDILAVPISTIASDAAFNTGGRVLDEFRGALTPDILEGLICAQSWLRKSQQPTCVEEQLEELEDLEEELFNLEIGGAFSDTDD